MKKYIKRYYFLFLEKIKSKPIEKENLQLLNELIISTDEKKFT